MPKVSLDVPQELLDDLAVSAVLGTATDGFDDCSNHGIRRVEILN